MYRVLRNSGIHLLKAGFNVKEVLKTTFQRKNKSNFLCLNNVLPLVLILSISACGGGGGGNEATVDEPSTPITLDQDSDGVIDSEDAFPNDPTETIDTDDDGIGNNADTDDDNDGTLDEADAFPLDATEVSDYDNDGIGDNSDTDDDNPLSKIIDSDNDGIFNYYDSFPFDATETLDTDNDGIGNNADSDDDNDTVEDALDNARLSAASSSAPTWDRPQDSIASKQVITEDANDSEFLFNIDIDNDGDIDIISAGDNIILHRNNGEATPTFTSHTLIYNSSDILFVADINGDENLDIIAGNYDELTVYINNTIDAFDYTTHSVDIAEKRIEALSVIDVTGDGSLDIIIAGYDGSYLYSNDGNSTPNFTEHTIGKEDTDSLAAGDFDEDGDIDIVASEAYENDVYFYENDGELSASFEIHILNDVFNQVSDVDSGDIDGDGDLDIIASSRNSGQITWLKNTGSQDFSFTYHLVGQLDEVENIALFDMDSDGDLDVVSAMANNEINWYENDGADSPNFTVSNSLTSTDNMFLADLNNDGIAEIITVIDDTISWYATTQRIVWHEQNTDLVLNSEPASDADNNTLTYALAGGADKELFTIDTSSGELTFIQTPSFTSPHDYSSDGVYDVSISVSDGFSTINRIISITAYVNDDDDDNDGVLDVDDDLPTNPTEIYDTDNDGIGNNADTDDDNDGVLDEDDDSPLDAGSYTSPVWTTSTNEDDGIAERNIMHPENTLFVLTESASDEDLNTLTYSIYGGFDQLLFDITPNTGALSFKALPDFSTPLDADLDNVYELTLSVTDGYSVIQRTLAITIYIDDEDDDNDGVDDIDDAFPLDAYEQYDSDNDGIGNNEDTDDDNDGILDYLDNAPTSLESTYAPTWNNALSLVNEGQTLSDNTNISGSLVTVDLDGDGYLDVLSAGSEVIWHRNNGEATPTFTEQSLIDATVSLLKVIDIDNDGDLDIITSYSSSIKLYANDGTDTYTYVSQTIGSRSTEDFEVADVTGDGSLDIIVSGSSGVYIYSNDGELTPSFTELSVTENDGDSVTVADFDGDNHLDIATSETYSSIIKMYTNDGELTPSFEYTSHSTSFTWISGIDSGDIDGDGDIDLIGGSSFSGRVDWLENNGAFQPTFTVRAIYDGVDNERIVLVDMDGDNDLDVVTATDRSDIHWFENDGSQSPQFTTHDPSATSLNVFAADLNSDGIAELLTLSSDLITWYSTIQVSVWHEEGTSTVPNIELASDVDGNTLTYEINGADKDLFTINQTSGELNFITSPYVASPSDENSDSVYTIAVSASDGFSSINRSIAVTVYVNDADDDNDGVLDVDDDLPTDPTETVDTDNDGIGNNLDTDDDGDGVADEDDSAPLDDSSQTSPAWDEATNEESGIAERNKYHAEYTLNVLTESASDEDLNTLTYSLAGGVDQLLFDIVSNTGTLSFKALPSFDSPTDFDLDNVYEVTISVTDGFSTIERTVAITVYVDDDDDDNDGVDDIDDAFPYDPYEQYDTDNDGIGNNADTDDDGDDILDYLDNAPTSLDSIEPPVWSSTENSSVSDALFMSFDSDVSNLTEVDFNSDGYTDFITSGDEIKLFLNIGDGSNTYTESTLVADSASNIFVVDINSDEKFDLIHSRSGSLYVQVNNGLDTPSFTEYSIATSTINDIEVADINADGAVDIVIGKSTGIKAYLNDNNDSYTFTFHSISTSDVDEITVGDFDGDGDIDIASIQEYSSTAYWYENDGNSSPSFTTITISTPYTWLQAIDSGDADNDGDIDLLMGTSFGTGRIAWFENDGLSDPSFSPRLIDQPDDITTVAFVDMDFDGDLDVVATELSYDYVYWYENDGSESPSFIAQDTRSHDGIVSAFDVDGNGYRDFLQFDGTSLYWYNNIKHNFLHAESSLDVLQQLVATDPDSNTITYVIVGGADETLFTIDSTTGLLSFISAPTFSDPDDANGDSKYEVLIGATDGYSTITRAVTVELYINDEDDDNDGVLDINDAFPTDPSETLDTDNDGIGNNLDTDDDGDGVDDDNDSAPLSSESQTSPTWDLDENINSGIAERNIFHLENTLYVLTETASDEDLNTLTYGLTGTDASLFDIDAETGALSFKVAPELSAPTDENADNIYEVTLTVTDSFMQTIYYDDEDYSEYWGDSIEERTVAITIYSDDADDDNDGVDDINDAFPLDPFEQYDNDNDGVGDKADNDDDNDGYEDYEDNAPKSLISRVTPIWDEDEDYPATGQIIASSDSINTVTYSVDFDGDNDIDIISSGSSIVLHRNNGELIPTFTSEILIEEASTRLIVEDIDGDDDLDIISTYNSTTTLYADDGTNTLTYIVHTISSVDNLDFSIADINADDSLDIVIGGDDGVYLYTNDGELTPSFTSSLIRTTDASKIMFGDYNGDEFLDIATVEVGSSYIYIYSNNGELTPSFTTQYINPSLLSSLETANSADIDGDGDIDFIVTDRYYGEIIWLENDGGRLPTFTDREIYDFTDEVVSIVLADMDGDNDLDIVNTTDESNLFWFENDGSQSPTFTLHESQAVTQFISVADIDNNGVLEILAENTDIITAYPIINRSVVHIESTLPVLLLETASDNDSNKLTYSITGGADKSLFAIDSDTGNLNFINAPVFAAPVDANIDNIYEIIISVSDGYSTINRIVAITVLEK